MNRKKRGFSGLQHRPHPLILLPRRRTVLHYKSKLHTYHIICISMFNICEESDCYQALRKARAVCRSSPVIASKAKQGEVRWGPTTSSSVLYSSLSETLIVISLSEKRGLCAVPLPASGGIRWGLASAFSKFPITIKLFSKQGLCAGGFPRHCEQSEARGKSEGAAFKIVSKNAASL